jgi:hypothetical protein
MLWFKLEWPFNLRRKFWKKSPNLWTYWSDFESCYTSGFQSNTPLMHAQAWAIHVTRLHRVKISQIVDKSRTRLLRSTDLQQVVSTSLITSALNKLTSLWQQVATIDIIYTLDSASNYSVIQKLKPWLQTQDIPMKWEDSYVSIS